MFFSRDISCFYPSLHPYLTTDSVIQGTFYQRLIQIGHLFALAHNSKIHEFELNAAGLDRQLLKQIFLTKTPIVKKIFINNKIMKFFLKKIKLNDFKQIQNYHLLKFSPSNIHSIASYPIPRPPQSDDDYAQQGRYLAKVDEILNKIYTSAINNSNTLYVEANGYDRYALKLIISLIIPKGVLIIPHTGAMKSVMTISVNHLRINKTIKKIDVFFLHHGFHSTAIPHHHLHLNTINSNRMNVYLQSSKSENAVQSSPPIPSTNIKSQLKSFSMSDSDYTCEREIRWVNFLETHFGYEMKILSALMETDDFTIDAFSPKVFETSCKNSPILLSHIQTVLQELILRTPLNLQDRLEIDRLLENLSIDSLFHTLTKISYLIKFELLKNIGFGFQNFIINISHYNMLACLESSNLRKRIETLNFLISNDYLKEHLPILLIDKRQIIDSYWSAFTQDPAMNIWINRIPHLPFPAHSIDYESNHKWRRSSFFLDLLKKLALHAELKIAEKESLINEFCLKLMNYSSEIPSMDEFYLLNILRGGAFPAFNQAEFYLKKNLHEKFSGSYEIRALNTSTSVYCEFFFSEDNQCIVTRKGHYIFRDTQNAKDEGTFVLQSKFSLSLNNPYDYSFSFSIPFIQSHAIEFVERVGFYKKILSLMME